MSLQFMSAADIEPAFDRLCDWILLPEQKRFVRYHSPMWRPCGSPMMFGAHVTAWSIYRQSIRTNNDVKFYFLNFINYYISLCSINFTLSFLGTLTHMDLYGHWSGPLFVVRYGACHEERGQP